jgi:hypothetical protein
MDCGKACLDAAGISFEHDDGSARLGNDLRDSGSHRAEADYCYTFELSHQVHVSF